MFLSNPNPIYGHGEGCKLISMEKYAVVYLAILVRENEGVSLMGPKLEWVVYLYCTTERKTLENLYLMFSTPISKEYVL